MTKKVQSWGHYPKIQTELVRPAFSREELTDLSAIKGSVLPYGYGRSYGDSCMNDVGVGLDCRFLNRLLAFDDKNGLLRCEAGVRLDEILDIIVPRGWFLPVTPGTKFVSVGGAIANDIHGKNHHKAGTFGCHVTCFELLRSDGERLICSPTENVEWYQATIGGLGLTGLILWAEFKLKPITNAFIDEEQILFSSIDEFFELTALSDKDYEYTVSWVDCLNAGKNLGRGHFMRGNHSHSKYLSNQPAKSKLPLQIPFEPPSGLVNSFTMKAFTIAYYHTQLAKRVSKVIPYEPFFYPLDAIKDWNRAYGPSGFLQYQCSVPFNDNYRAIKEIIGRIGDSGEGSFLVVLKTFGDIKSPGMLSFPRPGVTLAIDFPFKGQSTLSLLEGLDKIVRANGGAVYPAKDARMSAENFQHFYPNWREFAKYIDPKFSSNFWRRVTQPLLGD